MTTLPDASFLFRLADAAARETLPRFRTPLDVQSKPKEGYTFDPVTEADREAERAIRALIEAEYPAHAILGEEFGLSGSGDHLWVIDPVDGTRPFICGFPVWGTLIGLTVRGRAEIGIMSQPYTRERFWATGEGAFGDGPLGERPLKVRDVGALSAATLCSTAPELFKGTMADRFRDLSAQVRLTRFGTDCYAFAMLASGHVDLCVEPGLQPYDIVALTPIVEKAGGVISTFSGERPEGGGDIVAAATPALTRRRCAFSTADGRALGPGGQGLGLGRDGRADQRLVDRRQRRGLGQGLAEEGLDGGERRLAEAVRLLQKLVPGARHADRMAGAHPPGEALGGRRRDHAVVARQQEEGRQVEPGDAVRIVEPAGRLEHRPQPGGRNPFDEEPGRGGLQRQVAPEAPLVARQDVAGQRLVGPRPAGAAQGDEAEAAPVEEPGKRRHEAPRGRRAVQRDERRADDEALDMGRKTRRGRQRRQPAHGMGDDRIGRRAAVHHHLAQEPLQIVGIVRHAADMADAGQDRAPPRAALAAPVEARNREAPGVQVGDRLVILLQRLVAPLQQEHGAPARHLGRPRPMT